MKLTDKTRFPHPVLGVDTDDFTKGEFDVSFMCEENSQSGALTIKHQITLTEPNIKEFIINKKAAVGCFVRCEDTYFSELLTLSWSKGISDFTAGKLLNKVSLRPIIWLLENISDWDPGTINHEFLPPVSLEQNKIIAIGSEHIISVGKDKLKLTESIFQLDQSPDLEEWKLKVDPEQDRIAILVGPKTFDFIIQMRGQESKRPIVMNAVYLPVVMEVLGAVIISESGLEDYRWYKIFSAKCVAEGIDLSSHTSILEGAQKLLGLPTKRLLKLAEEKV